MMKQLAEVLGQVVTEDLEMLYEALNAGVESLEEEAYELETQWCKNSFMPNRIYSYARGADEMLQVVDGILKQRQKDRGEDA